MEKIKLFLLWLVIVKKDFGKKSILYLLKVYLKKYKKLPQADVTYHYNLTIKKLFLNLLINKKY